jgi:hypothetical protein
MKVLVMPKLPKLTVVIAILMVAGIGAMSAGTTELSIRDRANANPSIAAQGGFVVVTWAAATATGVTDIYAATSRDTGRTFGRPAHVNDLSGDATISGEQPPRVTLVPRKGAEPVVVVVWTAKGASGTRLLSARSDDGGRSFGHSTPVPGGEAAGNRGWEAAATDRDGHVFVSWLDHRELAETIPSSPPMHHDGQAHTGHGDADGVARAELSKLYVARLDAVGAAQAVTGGVCYCCKTALATGTDGAVYAAWRHVYPGNIRDIAFTVSRDGGRTFARPIRVSEDQWVLDGCPENGPTLAVDDFNTVHVAWPTLVTGSAAVGEPTLALFYAATHDGLPFSARQQLHTEGVPRHPQIALGPRGSLLIAWDEQANGTRRVAAGLALPTKGDRVNFVRQNFGGAERSEYPAVTGVDGGFAVAWTSGSSTQSVIRIERIPILR